jgi:hypothetical protein
VIDHEPAEELAGDYYSRSPLVNIAQSALHEHLEHKRDRARVTRSKKERDRDEAAAIDHDDERMGDPFTKGDIKGWATSPCRSCGAGCTAATRSATRRRARTCPTGCGSS